MRWRQRRLAVAASYASAKPVKALAGHDPEKVRPTLENTLKSRSYTILL